MIGLFKEPRVILSYIRLMNTEGIISIGLLSVLILVAMCSSILAPHDPLAHNLDSRLDAPSLEYYFGTDGFGRDVFSRVLYGTRISLFVGGVSAFLATLVGTFIGILSAYVGGKADTIIQRILDTVIGFPFLVLILLIVVAFPDSITSIIVGITIAQVPPIARLSRSSALPLKNLDYINAAVVNGATNSRIILRHLFPNSFAPVLAQVSGYFGAAVTVDTSLGFLGLGIPPPHPSWGGMIQDGVQNYFEVAPWVTLFPIAALVITLCVSIFLGDSIRNLMDPFRVPQK